MKKVARARAVGLRRNKGGLLARVEGATTASQRCQSALEQGTEPTNAPTGSSDDNELDLPSS